MTRLRGLTVDVRAAIGTHASAVETAVVALLAGAAGVAGSYAVASFTPSFVVGPIAGFLARRLPAAVITFGIVVLGDLGSQVNVLTAFALAVALLGSAAGLGVVLGRTSHDRQTAASAAVSACVGGVVATMATAGVAFLVTGALVASLAAGLAAGVVVVVAELARSLGDGPAGVPTGIAGATRQAVARPARRRLLAGLASALALVLGGYLLGSRRPTAPGSAGSVGSGGSSGSSGAVGSTGPAGSSGPSVDVGDPWAGPEVDALLAEADRKSLAVPGLEPLVSTSFYTVDINAADPRVDARDWTLSVTGAVEREVSYTYEDIASREMTHQFVSLRCVGESLNGKKMDNAVWSGVPIADLVEPAGPAEQCCVMFRAADGYYEEFPLPALRDGFLAIGMNGEALPAAHGYPARALIPGHWGEINVKWLTEIEILEQEVDGYWEERGWHGTGPVNTVAKLHVVEHLEDGRIQVGGHAYAGTRGIDRVEVSTDGGQTWTDAELSEPLPGDDVWRQWAHTYQSPGTGHEVVVRATDGTGALQPSKEASPFPNGPSGWVSQMVRR